MFLHVLLPSLLRILHFSCTFSCTLSIFLPHALSRITTHVSCDWCLLWASPLHAPSSLSFRMLSNQACYDCGRQVHLSATIQPPWCLACRLARLPPILPATYAKSSDYAMTISASVANRRRHFMFWWTARSCKICVANYVGML